MSNNGTVVRDMSVDYATGELLQPISMGPLALALARAQASFPAITRSKTVRVTTKTGGAYTFAYAPLESILDAVRRPLADNKLALAQLLDRGDLVTVLLHESGASLEARTPIPPTTDVQAYGSAITYLRRYALQALLGIAAEEDDDGNHATGNEAAPTKPKAVRTAPTPVAARSVPLTASNGPSLDEDAWAGIVDGTPPPKPTALLTLSGPELFSRAEKAGIDKDRIYATGRQMYGNRRVVELSDAERGALFEEVSTP